MDNQTAVEWLIQNMPNISKHIPFGIALEITAKFQQAKAMEKQQIEKAFYDGDCNGTFKTINASKYYNETYGKEGGEG